MVSLTHYKKRTNIEKLAYKSANSYNSLDFMHYCSISLPNQNNSLQMFMQQGFSNTNYYIQEGQALTGEPSMLSEIAELFPPK